MIRGCDYLAWPFVLFEVLYQALGIHFERTSIRLKFDVVLINSSFPGDMGQLPAVDHSLLKDHQSLAKRYWQAYAEQQAFSVSGVTNLT